ncbi:toll/interleukin-1 receptor domain-containing protein [Thalassobacillus pellis]|uniref:toll/interleukin-1 receptor domain-containing protein n=1 Tax=Thalassobacillus pellis TaxID=748008 RepID=UPI001961492A|nr:toll/interleukin-1 receptor domain-containing protein [Thalassobacillus pellis]MBM7554810.1 hypothetical protein [Thalassobacillus pellis]
MMTGINFANKSHFAFGNKYKEKDKCIFISYKKEDVNEAVKIGDFIMENDIDIYLDIFDHDLKNAAKDENHELITKHLEDGISKSTHLLSIISEKTRSSWWVPYEIGYSKGSKINIASLLLKDFDDTNIPSYLKISRIIYDKRGFEQYLNEALVDYYCLFEKYSNENNSFISNVNKLKDILKST